MISALPYIAVYLWFCLVAVPDRPLYAALCIPIIPLWSLLRFLAWTYDSFDMFLDDCAMKNL